MSIYFICQRFDEIERYWEFAASVQRASYIEELNEMLGNLARGFPAAPVVVRADEVKPGVPT